MMNSTEKLSSFSQANNNFYSPTRKNTYFEYDFSDKKAKKYKKWSFGNLFRRKKKANESSSDDDVKVSNIDEKKRKSENKKKPVTVDHIAVTQQQRQDTPTGIQSNYRSDNQIANFRQDQSSLESINKRSRKELAKVRAQARRTPLNATSSSDEDSQISASSYRLKSTESISKLRDSSFSKKSRAYRTERYLKRHSREYENFSNTSRLSKSDAESSLLKLSQESIKASRTSPCQLEIPYSVRSLSSQSSSTLGLSTVPPSHVYHSKFMRNNLTSNSMYHHLTPPLKSEYNNNTSTDSYRSSEYIPSNKRCYSFDANIHRPENYDIIHAKLELGKPRPRNITLLDNYQLRQYYNNHQLPRPPPRDNQQTQCLHTGNQNSRYANISPFQLKYNYSKGSSSPPVNELNKSFNLHSSFKSASEDYIPRCSRISLVQRPSSTTPMSDKIWSPTKLDLESRSENYQYLTEKRPRSRKPIFIQNDINKSMSHKAISDINKSKPNDKESTAFLDQLKARKSRRGSLGSSQICSFENEQKSNIFLPSVISNAKFDDKASKVKRVNADNNQIENDPNILNQMIPADDKDSIKKKSSNLEEALNELEIIYNSLRLGDEDLLEMAEKREEEVATKKILDNVIQFQPWNAPRGTLSDSGFSYKSFDSIDTTRRKRLSGHTPKSDDMAFRKINRENRAATINDPENVSKISYLFSSPLYSHVESTIDHKKDSSEPNITLDDVVYRTIKQSNKFQLPEHPPPFGIPLGPITLAANSDYLHVVPDRKTDKSNTIPDLVKDDLAYRSLRKDNNFIEPPLPPVSADDLKNNNLSNHGRKTNELYGISSVDVKKKRPVRSKSANISSLICQEVIERASRRNARDKNRNTLSDIANTMQAAHEVLKQKEIKINDDKKASLSDTDAGSSKYTQYPFLCEEIPFVDFDFEETKQTLSNTDSNQSAKYLYSEPKSSISMSRPASNEVSSDYKCSFEDNPLRLHVRTDSFEDMLTALAIDAKEAGISSSFDKEEYSKARRKEILHIYYDQDDSANEIRRQCEKNLDCLEKIQFSEDAVPADESGKEAEVESDHDYENIAADMKFEKYEDLVTAASENFKEKIGGELAQEETNNYKSYNEDKKEVWCNESSGENCVDIVQMVASRSLSEFACIETRDGKCNALTGKTSFCNLDIDNKSSSSYFRSLDYQDVAPRNAHYSLNVQATKLKVTEKLKSPKLVLETSKLSLCSHTTSTQDLTHCGRFSNSSQLNHMLGNLKPSSPWTNHHSVFAIACLFGVACFYELASPYLFTLGSVFVAVVAFIAVCFV